ncbi:hypothetical protein SASPL_150198 [Salvia splendens]|uniref:Disease resistance N-terminal domain-containing protein n=1 Tax=Salvia splendens TaxID=180675 RepID=A0A8X8W6W3_SALSN|nr:hypothetical protein SASPL_150198 [Salvia splendens]
MEDPMDILGNLPLLLDLSMIGGCFQGVEITCSASAFPSLERLLIRDLPHLRQWNVEQGTMPVVYKMVIDNCHCLKIVPDGFEFLHSLSYLQVCGMPALGVSAARSFHCGQRLNSVKQHGLLYFASGRLDLAELTPAVATSELLVRSSKNLEELAGEGFIVIYLQMAEGVASMALKTIQDLLLEEAKFLIGVRSEVKTLDVILKEMKALLIAADNRESSEDMVRHWLRHVRDLAYRADDTISLYPAIYVSSNRSMRHQFSCILTEGYSLHKIGSEIKEIKSEMARLKARMDPYGMHRIIQGESSAQPSVSICPFGTEVFVGKKEEVEQLVSI